METERKVSRWSKKKEKKREIEFGKEVRRREQEKLGKETSSKKRWISESKKNKERKIEKIRRKANQA